MSLSTALIITLGILLLGLWFVLLAHRGSPWDDTYVDPRHYEADSPKPWRYLAVAGAALGIAYYVVHDDIEAAHASAKRDQAMLLSLRDCPLKQPGDTDLVVMSVFTTADGIPDKTRFSCSRIVERGYVRLHREGVAIAGAGK